MKKQSIGIFKDQVKGMYGYWGATIDIGDSQIQVISPNKKDRDKMVSLIKSAIQETINNKIKRL